MEGPEPPDLKAIRPRVEQLLKEVMQTDDLPTGESGQWGPFPFGTTGVYLKLGQPGPQVPPVLVVVSMVLAQVKKSPELLDFLNDINANSSFLRAVWTNDAVFFSAELLAQTMDREELLIAAGQVANAADNYDEVLQERFGGVRPYVDDVGPPDEPASPW
jgi:hypothetical protein